MSSHGSFEQFLQVMNQLQGFDELCEKAFQRLGALREQKVETLNRLQNEMRSYDEMKAMRKGPDESNLLRQLDAIIRQERDQYRRILELRERSLGILQEVESLYTGCFTDPDAAKRFFEYVEETFREIREMYFMRIKATASQLRLFEYTDRSGDVKIIDFIPRILGIKSVHFYFSRVKFEKMDQEFEYERHYLDTYQKRLHQRGAKLQELAAHVQIKEGVSPNDTTELVRRRNEAIRIEEEMARAGMNTAVGLEIIRP